MSQETQKTVGLVESEKTALIASHYLPQSRWFATGGKHGCFKSSSLTPLLGRNVILFPDLGATAYWQEKMLMMQSMGIEVQLFDYLERHAPSKDQHEGYDIADYLLQIKTKESVLSELIRRNPALKLLVDKFELRVVEETRQTKPPLRKRGLRR